MSNAIANRAAGAVAALSSLKSGLQNVTATIVARGGDPFLRLLTDGTWVYGADNVEVEEGSLWAVNPFSLMHGWVSWTDHPGKQKNEIVGEVMVPMGSPLPDLTTMKDTNWPWTQQLSFQVQCINGEDQGTSVLYKTTSVGGMSAVKALLGKLMAQLDVDPEHPVPVLELSSDHYNHAKYGKTYVPVFEVRQWSGMDAVELDPEDEGDAPADEPEAPAAEQQTVAAPQQTRAASPRQAAADALLEQEAARATAADPAAPVRRRRR